MEVLNILGHGLYEKVYENALCEEFRLRDIPFQQQRQFIVDYKGIIVGEYFPDLIAYDKIIIELKTIDKITDHEKGQVINYLKITDYKLGILLNFRQAKLEWERIVL